MKREAQNTQGKRRYLEIDEAILVIEVGDKKKRKNNLVNKIST